MLLYLVRHGESTWNAEHRVIGAATTPPLTDRGRSQAAEAAGRLRGTGARTLLASDLVRATQTAAVIGATLELPVRTTALLREQDAGVLTGRRSADLSARPTPAGFDVADLAWAEGAESLADVAVRMHRLIAQVRTMEGPAIMVGHADSLRVLAALLAGRSHREVDWTPLPHGGILTATLH